MGWLGKIAKEKYIGMSINNNMNDDEKKELRILTLEFSGQLKQIIKPKDQSDRTTFRRIALHLRTGIEDNKFTTQIFKIVLDFAKEAAGPDSRNPAAVFLKILKDEIGYGKETD